MSDLEAATAHLLALQEQASARADAPLAALHGRGRDHFAAAGLPHTKLEEWRYTSLAPLARARFALPERRDVVRSELERVAIPVFACSLYVFVDGHYDPALSALGAEADPHVDSVRALGADGARLLGDLADEKAHPFAALN